jgi:serine/threonine protein kinase
MELSVQNLCGLLIRSRLLTADQVRVMYQRWLGEAKGNGGNSALFGKWLVEKNYVTAYQAALLARGHADNFFCNQYKILDRLGQGRMAGVYKAQHNLGQIVAIKVLPPSRAKDPQMMARFQREARLAMKLKHPNVVRTFQVGQAGPLHYLVMEYLDGETLDEVLQRRGKLPPQEGVRLIHQALMGLQHIHEQGLVHRDLKPANLMLVPGTQKGQPDTTLHSTLKILDIGLGRELFDENAPVQPKDFQLTGEGVLLGTPDYLAPEQARDAHNIDIRADIYSLGCVLYHVLTGQPPFPDTNIISQMVRHASETPKPLKELNPAVPDGLQQIMNWMLAKNPTQRYPTPERAAQALQVFLVAGNEPLRSPESDPEMRSYLKWLDSDDGRVAGSPGSAMPGGFPGPMPAGVTPDAPLALPIGMTRKHQPAAPSMPSYGPPGGAPRPATPYAGPVPTPVPTPVPAPANAPIPVAPPATKKKRDRKKKRGSGERAINIPVAGPPGQQVRVLDVELVPIAQTMAPLTNPSASEPPQRFGLTRRDWLFLGIGASGVIGVLIGAAYLLQKKKER